MRRLERVEQLVVEKNSIREGDAHQPPKRRSSRVVIDIPVKLIGQDTDRKMFVEETKTVSVNSQGALVIIKSNIDARKPVLIANPKTEMEAQCRVAFRKENTGGGSEIGLEFADPIPKFWGIHFPPDDWDPAERKRPVAPQKYITNATKSPKR
jgi:hypothetical protein